MEALSKDKATSARGWSYYYDFNMVFDPDKSYKDHGVTMSSIQQKCDDRYSSLGNTYAPYEPNPITEKEQLSRAGCYK
jgi:hypothetical protein